MSAALPIPVIQALQVATIGIGAPWVSGVISRVEARLQGRPAAGHRGYRGLGALHALTLGAISVIMTASNAFVLLFGRELLTVAFYLLAGFERRRRDRPGDALVTLVFGKVSGASLLAGLLLLASRSGSMTLASFARLPGVLTIPGWSRPG
jgi:formate hydrogenlyase subunit 3/multisubunit Na+/H+ antiporter MnhD subunit